MPKGYIVTELTLQTPGRDFHRYRAKVAATVDAYGGRFLVRGGDPKVVEGDDPAGFIIVLEFDTTERAMEWYNSAEYQAILPLRLRTMTGRVTCSTGV